MKKFAKILPIPLGFGLLTATLGFLTSSPAAQAPSPTRHAHGEEEDRATRTRPVMVTNPPLFPQLASDTITLSASSLVSPGCSGRSTNPPFEMFTFNTFVVKNSGVLEPFTLPAGQVLVVTNFSWAAYGSSAVANQVRIASLFPANNVGFSAAEAQSAALADSTGRSGGSQTFPTGIVLQNPGMFCLDLNPAVSGEVVSGTINGFLAPDR